MTNDDTDSMKDATGVSLAHSPGDDATELKAMSPTWMIGFLGDAMNRDAIITELVRPPTNSKLKSR